MRDGTIRFELSPHDRDRVRAWSAEQDKIVREQDGGQEPNYGAIGGALTFCFTPNALGMIVLVRHAVSGNVLDLTDYDSW